MSAQHTPGPWHVGEGVAQRIIYDSRGWPIADAKLFHGNSRSGEDVPNARLIAAAPDMLEALKAIIDNDGGEGSKHYHAIKLFDAREKARAAIAKATGGAV